MKNAGASLRRLKSRGNEGKNNKIGIRKFVSRKSGGS